MPAKRKSKRLTREQREERRLMRCIRKLFKGAFVGGA